MSPSIYAKLYMAAYKGIKAGNPLADVAVGSTSNRGRNKPTDKSGTVAPATFARLLSQANPNLPFVAWATHPYPTATFLGPRANAAYPAVTMTRLDQFGKDLEKWFHRRVPIWVTEYAEQTKPEYPGGVSLRAAGGRRQDALDMAAKSPYVEMFVWFILKDSTDKTWNSGLVARSRQQEAVVRHLRQGGEGDRRPGARGRREQVAHDPARHPVPDLRQRGRREGRHHLRGARGQEERRRRAARRDDRSRPDRVVPAKFKPQKGHSYVLNATVGDKHGQVTKRSVSLTVT